MYLAAERNDIGLGHDFSLGTNRFAATALQFCPAAIPTTASLARVVMSEADTVRADAIGNYAEFVVTVWDVGCRETH